MKKKAFQKGFAKCPWKGITSTTSAFKKLFSYLIQISVCLGTNGWRIKGGGEFWLFGSTKSLAGRDQELNGL